jgi:8-oxo-dGTP pyrophosphatase MutT (NUDIX family)
MRHTPSEDSPERTGAASTTWLEGSFDRRDAPGQAPTAAATVVVVRDGERGVEVLLLERGSGGAFGGMWVFPGGKVEPADRQAAVRLPGDPEGETVEVAAARRAAVREAAEECGVALDPASLSVHSYWMPPPSAPRRFATWFFLAPAPGGVEPSVDGEEIRAARWVPVTSALAERDAGRLALAPPTWVTIWQFSGFQSSADALAEAAARPVRRFLTRAARQGTELALLWEGDAGYHDGDLGRAGPRRRLWVNEAGPWRAESPAEASG